MGQTLTKQPPLVKSDTVCHNRTSMADAPTNLKDLDITIIQPNPYQPRKQMRNEELQDLASSIQKHGVLEPIVVAHTPAGYQIIAGERRWRASKLAGKTTIPAVIIKTSPRGMLELSIIENLQREDLNALERAHALQRLIQEFRLGIGDIAKQIGKSAPYVSNHLRLLRLPDAVKDGLLSGLITEGHARAIVSLESNKEQIAVYKEVLRKNLNVRQTEDVVRQLTDSRDALLNPEKAKVTKELPSNAEIDNWAKQLRQKLGKNSDIRLRRTSRQTLVVIKLKGSPEDTQAQLAKVFTLTDE